MYHRKATYCIIIFSAFLVIFIIVATIAFICIGPQEALKYLAK